MPLAGIITDEVVRPAWQLVAGGYMRSRIPAQKPNANRGRPVSFGRL
jgi:hypothetical protein